MSKENDHVTLQIRLKGKKANPADPFIVLLARILKRPVSRVCERLEPGPLTLKKAYLNDDLKKLIVALDRNGFAVRVFAAQQLPAPETKSIPNGEPTESQTVNVSYTDGVRTVWKSGDVIDGLYEVRGSAAGGMGRVYLCFTDCGT